MPTLERSVCSYIVHGRGHGRDGTLVQSDWDYPRTAELFGWSLQRVQKRGARVVHLARRGKRCDHSGTDGTIDCDCGVTASQFIAAAGEYLDRVASW